VPKILKRCYPAEASAGIEPPDAQLYPDDRLSQMLADNRYYRPFLYRPSFSGVKRMMLPKNTAIEFDEEGSPPERFIMQFERLKYFKVQFIVQIFAGTGVGNVPKNFVTSHAATTMQWPFFVTMRYSVEHHPEDGAFNPDNYAKWLDALYEGLTKKMVPADHGQGTTINQTSSGPFSPNIGMNTGIVNIGSQARIIADDLVNTLANLLSTHRGSMSIDVHNPAGDTEDYAKRWLLVFHRARWSTFGVGKVISGTDIGADGEPVQIPKGLHVYYKAAQSDLASFVVNTIRNAGISCHLPELDASIEGVDLKLFVGDQESSRAVQQLP
jgi:hypothetical protein